MHGFLISDRMPFTHYSKAHLSRELVLVLEEAKQHDD